MVYREKHSPESASCARKNNLEADKLSRVFNDDLEWSLSTNTFARILVYYPELSVELFAWRLNCKLTNYVTRIDKLWMHFHSHGIITFTIYFHLSVWWPRSYKNGTGLDRISSDCTFMANTGLVDIVTADDKWAMSNTTRTTGHPQPSTKNRSKHPLTKMLLWLFYHQTGATMPRCTERGWGCHHHCKERFQQATEQLLYPTMDAFCWRHSNPIKPTVNIILAYLVSIHHKGLKFSAFQTARTALNNCVWICGGSDFSSHFLIKRFMQGILIWNQVCQNMTQFGMSSKCSDTLKRWIH